MANNAGTEGRFLDLDALIRCVQTLPKVLNDMGNFQQSVNNDMNALVERLNQLGNSTNWLKTNFEHVATQVANLQADVTLLQAIRTTSPPQEEGWEFGNDGGGGGRRRHRRFALQEEGFPGQMTGAQDGEMTTGPVEAQGDNAGYEDAEGKIYPEYSGHAEQLLQMNLARITTNSDCKYPHSVIKPLRNKNNIEPPNFPENLSALNAITSVSELVAFMSFYGLAYYGLDTAGMRRCLAEYIGIPKKILDQFLSIR